MGMGRQQQAFDKMRTKLTIIPVLVYSDPLAQTKIDSETGASKYVYSGIISEQCQGRKWRPVADQSKAMSDPECNYDIYPTKDNWQYFRQAA